jgi:hypothetical protein
MLRPVYVIVRAGMPDSGVLVGLYGSYEQAEKALVELMVRSGDDFEILEEVVDFEEDTE